jgi:hypothetical protein
LPVQTTATRSGRVVMELLAAVWSMPILDASQT